MVNYSKIVIFFGLSFFYAALSQRSRDIAERFVVNNEQRDASQSFNEVDDAEHSPATAHSCTHQVLRLHE
jgi:hypothetical protein